MLAPVMNGVPGSLQYSGGASLDPGEYTIKLAVAEGDRIGSVEHPVHAALVDVGEVKLSELMVGGPADATDILHPTVGYTVSFGSVHGYLEVVRFAPGACRGTIRNRDVGRGSGVDRGRRAQPPGGRRSSAVHAGDGGRQAAAWRVRAARHGHVRRRAAQDA